jgi:hypothetical protein
MHKSQTLFSTSQTTHSNQVNDQVTIRMTGIIVIFQQDLIVMARKLTQPMTLILEFKGLTDFDLNKFILTKIKLKS